MAVAPTHAPEALRKRHPEFVKAGEVLKSLAPAPPRTLSPAEQQQVDDVLPIQTAVTEGRFVDGWNLASALISTDAYKDHPHVHYLGGVCAQNLGNAGAALHLLTRAVDLAPHIPGYLDALASCYASRGEIENAIGCTQQAIRIEPASWRNSNLLFYLNDCDYVPPEVTVRAQRDWAKGWGAPHVKPPKRRNMNPDKRLKIGYVGADFYRHSAQYIFGGMIQAHDHDKFHITIYNGRSTGDDVTEVYKEEADAWVDVFAMDDATLARTIKNHGIDILVDLSGHSGGNRLPMFSRKPAPIQVSAWGYLTGTGLPEMDYLFGDPIVSPLDWAQNHLAETPWNLPCCVGFNPPQDAPDIGDLPELTNGYRTYGYLGRASKISPNVLAEWAGILQGDLTSKILIKSPTFNDPGTANRLKSLLWAHGVADDRIIMMKEAQRRVDHLGVYNLFDMALDTFPVGGGMTTLEASWMGVPTITKPREHMPSRIGTSIMHVLGYGYHDPHMPRERLQKIRAEMRGRMQDSVICSPRRYCEAVETAYRAMWVKYVEAQA